MEWHVEPSGESWILGRGTRRTQFFHYQKTAWEAAQRLAKEDKGRAVLHGKDGKVREVISFEYAP